MAGGNVSPQLGPLFVAAGVANKIPPSVLAGVAQQETSMGTNDPHQNLMSLGVPTASTNNPMSPSASIWGAARLLKSLGYAQNPMRALAAYNAGPNNWQAGVGYSHQVMAESNRLRSQVMPYMHTKSIAQAMAMPSAQEPKATTQEAPGQPKATTQNDYVQNQLLNSMLQGNSPNLLSIAENMPTSTVAAGKSRAVVSQAFTAKAVNDTAQVGGDANKLMSMIHSVIGGTYNQGNHADIGENASQIKAQGTDCSGLVSWLMGPRGLGIWNTSLATPSIDTAPGMQAGRGRQITVWNNKLPGNSGHVFIQIGNQFFASEGGVGIRQLPPAEAQMYIQHGSDGGTYEALHPKGL